MVRVSREKEKSQFRMVSIGASDDRRHDEHAGALPRADADGARPRVQVGRAVEDRAALEWCATVAHVERIGISGRTL
jgi:hypothetical protein